MRWLFNTAYVLLLTVLSPVIAWRMLRHGRYRKGISEKLLGRVIRVSATRPVVWFHAVSVGEVIQLQKVVDEFQRQTADRYDVVISTSTDTGYELAQKRFPSCQLTWFPLDFTWAVSSAMQRIQPAMVVLMELELWPNFLAECHRRAIPVAVVNARMSERSHRGYMRVRRLLAPLFRELALVAAQSKTYAERLQSMGVSLEAIRVTGSIKFDGVETNRASKKTVLLRQVFDLPDSSLVLMAGSTQEPEEQMAVDAWLKLRQRFAGLRLILVPRHRERFDEVAKLVAAANVPLIRRSGISDRPAISATAATDSESDAVLLLDTIGELSACWGLADIAFVGGSFGKRGGQNMIEPAAYGVCVLFGPNTSNFRDVVDCFRENDACIQLETQQQFEQQVAALLGDPARRLQMGINAREAVVRQQGATAMTASLLCEIMERDGKIAVAHDRAA